MTCPHPFPHAAGNGFSYAGSDLASKAHFCGITCLPACLPGCLPARPHTPYRRGLWPAAPTGEFAAAPEGYKVARTGKGQRHGNFRRSSSDQAGR